MAIATEERMVPDQHRMQIATVLKLPEDSDLPESMVPIYWSWKRAADRLGIMMTEHAILCIVMLWSMYHSDTARIPEDPVRFIDRVNRGEIVYDESIIVELKNRYHWALFKGPAADKSMVQVEVDGQERKIPQDRCHIRKHLPANIEIIGGQ